MSTTLLNDLIARSGDLSSEERKLLLRFLSDQVGQGGIAAEDRTREHHFGSEGRNGAPVVEWLKLHALEYAGQYVALNGSDLVGSGKTIRDAHAAAKRNGFPQALLLKVPAPEGGSWGGW